MIKRSDVVSRGAVAAVPTLDASWFDSGGRPIALIIALAIIAVIALVVAAAAHASGHRGRNRRAADDDSDLFTTTPLPVPKEELARMKREARHIAHGSFKLPRWVQIGSIVVACAITYAAAQRLRPDETAKAADVRASTVDEAPAGRSDADDESPESLDLAPASAPPFSFRAREWVATSGGCTGRLEVTKGAASGWNLTARVHDDRGQLLDSARARVDALIEGDLVEFRFRLTSCERIGAWDVSGDRRTP